MQRLNKKVLIATSEASLTRILAHTLESRHFLVRTAPDGDKALRSAHRWRPDIVVATVTLPIVDGLGLTAGLRRMSPRRRPRVILLRDVEPPRSRFGQSRFPPDAWVEMPFELDALHDRIDEAVYLSAA